MNWAVFAAALVTMACSSGLADAQTILGGSSPEGKLAQAADGTIYGTTYSGGDLAGCANAVVGCGTVFRVNTDSSAATVYTFGPNDGYEPQDVSIGSDGNVYGFIPYTDTALNEQISRFYGVTPGGSFTALLDPSFAQGYVYPPGSLVASGAGFLAPGCKFGKKDGPNGSAFGLLLSTFGALSSFPIKGPDLNGCYFEGNPTLYAAASGYTYVFNYTIVSISPAMKSKFISNGQFTISGSAYSVIANSGGYVDASGVIYVPALKTYTSPGIMSQAMILKVSQSGKGRIYKKLPPSELPSYLTGTSDGTLYGILYDSTSNGALFSISAAGVLSIAHQFGSVISTPQPCVPGQSTPTWTYATDGTTPLGEVTVAADGSLWGTTTETTYPTYCGGESTPVAPNSGGTVWQYIPATGQLVTHVFFNNAATEATVLRSKAARKVSAHN